MTSDVVVETGGASGVGGAIAVASRDGSGSGAGSIGCNIGRTEAGHGAALDAALVQGGGASRTGVRRSQPYFKLPVAQKGGFACCRSRHTLKVRQDLAAIAAAAQRLSRLKACAEVGGCELLLRMKRVLSVRCETSCSCKQLSWSCYGFRLPRRERA